MAKRPPRQATTDKGGAEKRSPAGGGASSRARLLLPAGIVVLLLVAAAIAMLLRPTTRAAGVERRANQNILLVTIDTLRADALSSYGGAAATPNFDALARQGVRFDFAHAHAVVTLPSHVSILSGQYPFQHGVRENSGYRVDPRTRTLATMLKAAGFATGAFIGAFPLDSRFGLDAGFDTYDDQYPGMTGPADFTLAERPAADVVAVARRWIGAQRGRWFAWVHVFDPHAPYRPPAPFDQQYRSSLYHGEVAYTDQALGSLLEIARQNTERPTLVVVTADHGEALGDHGETTHGVFAYEATLRVPLIVAQVAVDQPARRAGRVSATPVRHVDLAPTILDAVAVPIPSDLPGRTLLPLLNGSPDEGERTTYFEAMSASLNRGWAPLQGVLAGREKYIDLPLPELYDLGADPGEQVNLIDRRDDRRRALDARLKAFGGGAAGDRRTEDPEVARRLQALGYVTGSAPRKQRYTEADDPKRLIDLDRAIHQGIELYANRRFREAIDLYLQILARRDDMALAYRHLAFLYWEVGDVSSALSTLKSATRAGTMDASLQSQLGTYLAEGGSPAEAIALLEGPAAGPSPDLDVLNALGIAYARARQSARALDTFQRVLQVDPTNAMALANSGSVYLQQRDWGAARDVFSRALKADPRLGRAHSGLGVAQLKGGDRTAAIESWRRAAELDATDFDALYNLGMELLNDGQVLAARPYLEQFARTAPPAFYATDIRRIQAILQGR